MPQSMTDATFKSAIVHRSSPSRYLCLDRCPSSAANGRARDSESGTYSLCHHSLLRWLALCGLLHSLLFFVSSEFAKLPSSPKVNTSATRDVSPHTGAARCSAWHPAKNTREPGSALTCSTIAVLSCISTSRIASWPRGSCVPMCRCFATNPLPIGIMREI